MLKNIEISILKPMLPYRTKPKIPANYLPDWAYIKKATAATIRIK